MSFKVLLLELISHHSTNTSLRTLPSPPTALGLLLWIVIQTPCFDVPRKSDIPTAATAASVLPSSCEFISLVRVLHSYFEAALPRIETLITQQPSTVPFKPAAATPSTGTHHSAMRALHQSYTFFRAYLELLLDSFQATPATAPSTTSPGSLSAHTVLKETLRQLDLSLLLTGFPLCHTTSTLFLTTLHSILPKLSAAFSPLLPNAHPLVFAPLFPGVQEGVEVTCLWSAALGAAATASDGTEHGGHPLFTPFVQRNAIRHWPACAKWTLAYFIETSGYRTVPIELGATYADPTWRMQYMLLHEFFETHFLADAGPPARGASLHCQRYADALGAKENDGTCFLEPTSLIGYLAQYDLFRQLPYLEKDIGYPDLIFELDALTRRVGRTCTTSTEHPGGDVKEEEEEEEEEDLFHRLQRHVWLGPANTTTPFHHDGALHNVFTQVKGSKRVVLVPPKYTQAMDPYPSASPLKNTSQVDLDRWPLHRLREWIAQEQVEGLECVLEAGDALYIPPGWWHYVKSLTPSISVSFWW